MSAAVAITGAAAATRSGEPPLPEAVRARVLRAERVTQLVLAAGGGALAASGLAVTEGPPRPGFGVVVGTALGCFLTNAAYAERLADGGVAAASPRLFAATVSNAAAGELGIAYRLGGPAVTLSAGRAAGLVALGHAADCLSAGRAAALVAGGADAAGDALEAWIADGGLRLEDRAADAAAMVVLEPAAAARARGVTVLATLEGWAAGFEPARVRSTLGAVVGDALAEAGIAASDVSLVAGGAAERVEGRAGGRVVPSLEGDPLGASGPLALLAALAEAPPGAIVLVAETCPSGHVAALVARAGAPR